MKIMYLKIKGTSGIARINKSGIQSEVEIKRLHKNLKFDGAGEGRTCYLFSRNRLTEEYKKTVKKLVQELYPTVPDENIVKKFDTTSEFDAAKI